MFKNLKGLDLLHEGQKALCKCELNGICIDTEYCHKTTTEIKKKIKEKRMWMASTKEGKAWINRYGKDTNWNSGHQLGEVLFKILGREAKVFTKITNKPSTSYEALSELAESGDAFVSTYLEITKLSNAVNNHIKGFIDNSIDGVLRPSFNLHTARTYRSSSSNPNFQNIPKHDPEILKIVRRAIVPRKGHRLVETDYSKMEVIVAACYCQDPNLIKEVRDPETDMHRDMASACFGVPKEKVSKELRYEAKNNFVFPQFYGSYFKQCAKNLWDKRFTKATDGTQAMQFLKDKKIKKLGDCEPGDEPKRGTFERHIKEVEDRFWNIRFPTYNQWRKNWYKKYQVLGFFKTKTGFVCSGYMKKNDVINYPIQGSAFHCLLWSIIHLIQILEKKQMKTKIIGQIHDSIVADVPEEELKTYVKLCNRVCTKALPMSWKWINVPLEIETEVSEIDGNWSEMKELNAC